MGLSRCSRESLFASLRSSVSILRLMHFPHGASGNLTIGLFGSKVLLRQVVSLTQNDDPFTQPLLRKLVGRKPYKKQIVFMSLNLWQIRNDALHADKIMTDYNTQRRLLQTQTTTWYDKENEFEDDGRHYFHRPYLERITDPNHLLQAWCVTWNDFKA